MHAHLWTDEWPQLQKAWCEQAVQRLARLDGPDRQNRHTLLERSVGGSGRLYDAPQILERQGDPKTHPSYPEVTEHPMCPAGCLPTTEADRTMTTRTTAQRTTTTTTTADSETDSRCTREWCHAATRLPGFPRSSHVTARRCARGGPMVLLPEPPRYPYHDHYAATTDDDDGRPLSTKRYAAGAGHVHERSSRGGPIQPAGHARGRPRA